MEKINEKIIELKKIESIQKKIRGKKKVLVGGCFDVIHYGHLSFLKKAKEAGEILLVLLESDKFIRIKKKRGPIHTQKERAEIIASLAFVNYVILLPFLKNEAQYLEIVQILSPEIIAITQGDPLMKNKVSQAKLTGGNVKIVSKLEPRFSSSQIISQEKPSLKK